jgi:junctophilin
MLINHHFVTYINTLNSFFFFPSLSFRRYEGEWFANKKYGYGVTTFRDGTKEEGKYKNNVLITSQKKKHLFLIRSAKFRERIDAAVDSAQRASKYALQKADIAISRTATARGKAEAADVAADHARVDSEVAIQTAREFAPDFKPALLERFERIRVRERFRATNNDDQAATMTAAMAKSMGNNISPNKQQLLQPPQSSPAMQQQSQQQQQQHIQAPSRRTSVNPSAPPRQNTIEYSSQNNMYANENPIDYNSTLGHNQSQFSQPQPPGSSGSAFSTPQKLAQQQQQQQQQQQSYNNQAASNVSIQQSQHSQFYQNNSSSSHYPSMKNQQSQENSYSSYNQQEQQHGNHQAASYTLSDPHNGNLRRSSRQVSDSGRPMLGSINQASIDHFDHYKRPPSRDSSIDRYTRAASRLGGSRQPSVDRQQLNSATNMTPEITLDRNVRGASQMRGTTPAPMPPTSTNLNGAVLTGMGTSRGSRGGTPVFQQQTPTIQQIQAHYSSPNQPFEDVLLRQRTLGQDIVPSLVQPKRTESLFVPPKPMGGGGGAIGGGGGGMVASKGASKVSFLCCN